MAGDGLPAVGTSGKHFVCRSQGRRRKPVHAGHSVEFVETSTTERGRLEHKMGALFLVWSGQATRS